MTTKATKCDDCDHVHPATGGCADHARTMLCPTVGLECPSVDELMNALIDPPVD